MVTLVSCEVLAQPSPKRVIKILKAGNKKFVRKKSSYTSSDVERAKSKRKQKSGAIATIVACTDLHFPVELIFDTDIKNLFLVRVDGNICKTGEISAVEYGVFDVKTPLILVLGHTGCKAVTIAIDTLYENENNLEKDISQSIYCLEPAVQLAIADHPKLKKEKITPYAVKENIWQGIIDILMDSPRVRNAVKNGKVKIMGALYHAETGKVKWMKESIVKEILHDTEPVLFIN